ncbi:hypothetical protein Glaag_3056 [Glaciecola sp. 4H-3-7+YE-5]|nr:hypothetical protein Glaag_3056 [Glaciecola sp. 4H-3-7+YE-5]
MRFAQKQLGNKPSQSGFPALRRAQVVHAAGTAFLRAPLSPPCESSTPPDSHYTKSPDQKTVRAFSYMRFAQKQLGNKPSQSGFPALRRAQVVHAAGTAFLRAPLSPPCESSTPPDSHYTKSPDQTTVRAFSYMRFAQKQLSNKPSWLY